MTFALTPNTAFIGGVSLLTPGVANAWRSFFPFALDGGAGGRYSPSAPIILANGTPGVQALQIGDAGAGNPGKQTIDSNGDINFVSGGTITGTATLPDGDILQVGGLVLVGYVGQTGTGTVGVGVFAPGIIGLGHYGTFTATGGSVSTWAGITGAGNIAAAVFDDYSTLTFKSTAGNSGTGASAVWANHSRLTLQSGAFGALQCDVQVSGGTGQLFIGGTGFAGTGKLRVIATGTATFEDDSTTTFDGSSGHNAALTFGQFCSITYTSGSTIAGVLFYSGAHVTGTITDFATTTYSTATLAGTKTDSSTTTQTGPTYMTGDAGFVADRPWGQFPSTLGGWAGGPAASHVDPTKYDELLAPIGPINTDPPNQPGTIVLDAPANANSRTKFWLITDTQLPAGSNSWSLKDNLGGTIGTWTDADFGPARGMLIGWDGTKWRWIRTQ